MKVALYENQLVQYQPELDKMMASSKAFMADEEPPWLESPKYLLIYKIAPPLATADKPPKSPYSQLRT